MQLIGMLDSPFVRRVAISLLALKLPFTHRSISVFRGYETFQGINPVVKAPTAVLDDGTVLLDSTLILQYAEKLAEPRTLLPARPNDLSAALRVVGLALAACEKTVQVVYERRLRPQEKIHQPWIDRVSAQMLAAYSELEKELQASPMDARSCVSLGQAGITAAVAWHFTQQILPGVVAADQHPGLVQLSEAAERLEEFQAAAYGEGTVGGA